MVAMKFSTVFLFIIIYQFFDGGYGEQFDIWGDLGATNLIVGNSQTRYAFPLMKRTIDISYPSELEDGDESYGIIRGIQHSNRLADRNCQPDARLIRGGVNEEQATVRITSVRGCGLDSFVQFFIEPPHTIIMDP